MEPIPSHARVLGVLVIIALEGTRAMAITLGSSRAVVNHCAMGAIGDRLNQRCTAVFIPDLAQDRARRVSVRTRSACNPCH